MSAVKDINDVDSRIRQVNDEVHDLRGSLNVLATELKHVADGLHENNKNTKEIADSLNKMRIVIYLLILIAAEETIPILFKLVG